MVLRNAKNMILPLTSRVSSPNVPRTVYFMRYLILFMAVGVSLSF